MQQSEKQGWSHKKLNELGEVSRGKSKHRPRNDPALYGGNYPFIQTGDVKSSNFYISEYSQSYSDIGLDQSKLWHPNTLLITIAANIAETGILKFSACFPDSIVGFIADSKQADVRFIKYYIDTIKLHMQSISRGTTQDNLSLDKLLSFDFFIPKVAVQNKIANILSNYDRLIENNTRRIQILEEMAQNLYREWFVKFRFPGHEQTKLVDSGTDLGLIPEGWEIVELGELLDVKHGYAFKSKFFSSEPTPNILLTPGNFAIGGGYQDKKLKYYDGEIPEGFCLEAEDLLVTMTDLSKTGDTLGYPALVPFSKSLLFLHNQRLGKILIQSESPASKYFFYYLFCSDYYRNHILATATGSTVRHTAPNRIKALQIALPPAQLCQKFEDISGIFMRQIHCFKAKNLNLKATRDLLLPKLISGEIDVETLNNDEEAIAA